jgi:methylmalonyl-CoA decarboxylase subunit alpha
MPPRLEPSDDINRREENLLSVVPRSTRKVYDPRTILKYVLDRDSFFEIAPFYGRSCLTGLARINRFPVGVMINNPGHNGGVTDVAAGEKVIRLFRLCETFHLPLGSFTDEPGFMVDLESEKQGVERAGVIFCSLHKNSSW